VKSSAPHSSARVHPMPSLRRLTLLLLATLCLAPTPGDMGGCGQPARLLDGPKFFEQKRLIDCSACQSCAIVSQTCSRLCAEPLAQVDFPSGCFPLVHDGEVCLRALNYSDCDEYRRYLDDDAPSVPTECNFCPGDAGR
jgi:hypothetical protein